MRHCVWCIGGHLNVDDLGFEPCTECSDSGWKTAMRRKDKILYVNFEIRIGVQQRRF